MERARLFIVLIFLLGAAAGLRAQEKILTASNLPAFLDRYENNLKPVEAAYSDLENENLPLMDETGQPLGHRPIENRRQALAEVRSTLEHVRSEPGNLSFTLALFFQTESLTDDLFDLSQIAYDNDREELAKRFADLMAPLDEQRNILEGYALSLAREKEQRIERLERDNRDLQLKLKQAMKGS